MSNGQGIALAMVIAFSVPKVSLCHVRYVRFRIGTPRSHLMRIGIEHTF